MHSFSVIKENKKKRGGNTSCREFMVKKFAENLSYRYQVVIKLREIVSDELIDENYDYIEGNYNIQFIMVTIKKSRNYILEKNPFTIQRMKEELEINFEVSFNI